MHIYAIGNQKGGVAKTTTVASLAAALAAFGRRVLAVDLDAQANLTLALGLDPDAEGPSALEVVLGSAPAADAIRGTAVEGLDCLPAEIGLAAAERRLYGEVGFDEVLRARLAPVAGRYEYALIDCPPSLGCLTVNALTAASTVLVPVQCEFFSAKGLGQLLEVVALVRERRRPDLAVRVLPTLYDRRNKVCREILSELRAAYPDEVLPVVVDVDTRLREACARGVPIGVLAPATRAAVAYRALALEVIRRQEGEPAARDAVAARAATPRRVRAGTPRRAPARATRGPAEVGS
jgi:chromosome partitioning protein